MYTFQVSAEALFQHLCKIVDSPEVDQTSKLYRLSKQLIIDGECQGLRRIDTFSGGYNSLSGLFLPSLDKKGSTLK